MAASNQDDSWDFKIDDKDLEDASLKTKTTKATGNAPSISALKKTSRKPKSTKLSVDVPKRKKISRSAVAKRDAAAAAYAELMPPGFLSRIMATLFDYGIIAGVGVGCYFLKPLLKYHYTELLASQGINQTLDPKTLEILLTAPSFIILVFLLHLVPAMKFKATIGKKLFKMRIGHHTIGERPSSFSILLREGLLKPVSIVSVIGLLIGLKNDGNRPFHDMVCGTAMYIDD